MTRFAVFTGTANPTPTEPPAGERICELIPIILPNLSSSGPPEFPGLIEASVWIAASIGRLLRPESDAAIPR